MHMKVVKGLLFYYIVMSKNEINNLFNLWDGVVKLLTS